MVSFNKKMYKKHDNCCFILSTSNLYIKTYTSSESSISSSVES